MYRMMKLSTVTLFNEASQSLAGETERNWKTSFSIAGCRFRTRVPTLCRSESRYVIAYTTGAQYNNNNKHLDNIKEDKLYSKTKVKRIIIMNEVSLTYVQLSVALSKVLIMKNKQGQ